MCGIAGIIDFTGKPIERDALGPLGRALAHRGPDDTGIWTHQAPGFSVGLAHTRLAVIDPTPAAGQPMISADGRHALTYNGELYNYQTLRDELATPHRTDSDTEVVLHACIAWGPTAVERFEAMWALAFVDTLNQTGHLSRDPFGIKPLYYTCQNKRLVFASELAALRCVENLEFDIDNDALACYLKLGYIPHPRTIYKDICKLPPGHQLCFDASGPAQSRRFFHLSARPESVLPYDQACNELRELIQTSVANQRIADVPLGAFLSGGLDSSIVVACLSKVADRPVKTFSIGYNAHTRYDETRYARLVADHFKTDHHEFRLGFNEVLEAVEPMLNHLGEPFADSSLLPTSLVSRYTRRHVTVALSGDGGDELFGGYWRYLGHFYLARYNRLPALLRKDLIEPILRLLPVARSNRLLDRLRQVHKLLRGQLADPIDRHLAWSVNMDDALSAELLGKQQAESAAKYLNRLYREVPANWRNDPEYPTFSPSHLDPILLADLAIGLPADMLFKVDTASMFYGLEVRVPLLSADLVDFVTGLPIEYKINKTGGKRILKDAFRGMIPDPIINRNKMGFEVPVGEFLRNELRKMYHDVVTPSVLGDLGINADVAGRLFHEHLQRRADRTELLWSLLVLSWWKQNT